MTGRRLAQDRVFWYLLKINSGPRCLLHQTARTKRLHLTVTVTVSLCVALRFSVDSTRRSRQHFVPGRLVRICFLQEDIYKIREVLDEFLSKYPLCFGYWHQYASAEDKRGDRPKDVYEQGIQSTPYSIDLWMYYIDWLKEQESTTPDAVRMCDSRRAVYAFFSWFATEV
jgi:hypothetical protein